MMNGIAALERYLIENAELELVVNGNVYVGYFPPDKVKDGPLRSIVIRGTASGPDARLDTLHAQSVEINSIGASYLEAMKVDLAVCQVLRDLSRKTMGSVLLHNVQVATGVEQSANAETGWPQCRRTALLRFDEREVDFGTV
jgi:hypothetical protein